MYLRELVRDSVRNVCPGGCPAVRAEDHTIPEVDRHDRGAEIDFAALEMVHIDVDAI